MPRGIPHIALPNPADAFENHYPGAVYVDVIKVLKKLEYRH
jgi:hypothetical protein